MDAVSQLPVPVSPLFMIMLGENFTTEGTVHMHLYIRKEHYLPGNLLPRSQFFT